MPQMTRSGLVPSNRKLSRALNGWRGKSARALNAGEGVRTSPQRLAREVRTSAPHEECHGLSSQVEGTHLQVKGERDEELGRRSLEEPDA